MIKNPFYVYGIDNARVPAHLNFGKEIYDNMVKNKDMTALINADTEEQRTYGELAQMTADIALSLTRLGVEKGDVICICSEKNFEFLPTVVGIMCAGAAFSPTDPTYGSFSLLHRVNIVRPKVIFCSVTAYETHKPTFESAGCIQHYIVYGNETRDGAILFKDFLSETSRLEDFDAVPVNGWEDYGFVVYSSGTTGLPKGVPLTHLSLLLNAQSMVLELFTGSAVYNTRDFCYSYGLMFGASSLRVGITLVYNPSGGEKAMLEAIQKYKIKALQVTPRIITELIKSPILDNYDITSVEYIVSATTYCRKEVVKGIKERLPHLVSVLQFYGISEGGSICNEFESPKGPRPGSSGTPGYGMVMKVVDLESRKPLGPNQLGEICVKGPSIMKAYLNVDKHDYKDEEGFLKTGDVGYYDEDGYFYIASRIKDLIKYNDISTTPAEFEAILLQHPSVYEVCVLGKPHPKHGEAPTAFIVLVPGCSATEEELVQYVDSRMTYKTRLAGGVRFIEELPRSAGDKLDRKALAQRLQDEDINGSQCAKKGQLV